MQRRDVFLLVVLLILVIVVAHVFACERASQERLAVGGGDTVAGAFTHRLLPAGQTPHSHLAALGSRGDGASTVDLGHSHRVRGYEVKPAGPDAHVHDITQYVVEAR